VTKPLRCLGEMLATFVGRALGGAFFLLGKARGRKALHPRGEVLEGLIGRRGAVGRTSVTWLDEAGTNHVAVRFSRSLGLPAPHPDILGLALRIPTQPGQFGDVLLATTGTGHIGRYVLWQARRHGLRAYTSLFPYKTPTGPLLLAAIPSNVYFGVALSLSRESDDRLEAKIERLLSEDGIDPAHFDDREEAGVRAKA
jgi:hypothetical protein